MNRIARGRGRGRAVAARWGAGLGLSLALVVLLLPARARAQDNDNTEDIADAPPLKAGRYRSSQDFAFELKFGPYKPDIDSEFPATGPNARTPYRDFFGNNNHLLSQVEFDWQVFHRVGSLAIGVGVGYFQITGTAPLADGSGQKSGDQSTLKIVPLQVSAVYRFDYFLERYDIPLVPYGKLGLDYDYWQNTDGNGEIATDGRGGTGQGGTPGWHATVGAALVLDFFDPEAARDFDSDLGVNHTGITFELQHADVSGLGQANRLHLGDNSWALGLLMEF